MRGPSIKEMVTNYFGDQILRVRPGETEALITEAIAFAEKVAKTTPGRTTVQGWFKEYRDHQPVNVPAIHAD